MGFPDVPPDHWAAAAVERLRLAGIVKGYPDGTFGGDGQVTRYEMAAMLDRLRGETMAKKMLGVLKGVYVMLGHLHTIDAGLNQTWFDGYISAFDWKDMETAEGTYDFAALTTFINDCAALGKRAVLMLHFNGAATSPAWFNALLRPMIKGQGSGAADITAPWDSVYRTKTKNFLTAFANQIALPRATQIAYVIPHPWQWIDTPEFPEGPVPTTIADWQSKGWTGQAFTRDVYIEEVVFLAGILEGIKIGLTIKGSSNGNPGGGADVTGWDFTAMSAVLNYVRANYGNRIMNRDPGGDEGLLVTPNGEFIYSSVVPDQRYHYRTYLQVESSLSVGFGCQMAGSGILDFQKACDNMTAGGRTWVSGYGPDFFEVVRGDVLSGNLGTNGDMVVPFRSRVLANGPRYCSGS